MKLGTAIWLDRENAHIHKIWSDEASTEALHAHHHSHHTHSKNEQRDHDSSAFYHQIADKVKDASSLLIMGPGVAKTHFLDYIRKHSPQLATRVVGLEAVDHPTEGQVISHARKILTEFAKTGLRPETGQS